MNRQQRRHKTMIPVIDVAKLQAHDERARKEERDFTTQFMDLIWATALMDELGASPADIERCYKKTGDLADAAGERYVRMRDLRDELAAYGVHVRWTFDDSKVRVK